MTDQTQGGASQPRIAIIGAGPGGICAVKYLLDAGYSNLVVFEKTGAVGGTWNNNRYPGLACDVPSFLYSFSFEPKPDWSRTYAAQPEILAYMQDCARKYGLMPLVRLNTRITAAHWDDAAADWTLTDAAGATTRADIVISALGMFNEVSWPKIEGLDNFEGQVLHTADWPQGVDLAGRDIGVIGSGASAVQLIPEVARVARSLTVVLRSPTWVMPKNDPVYGPAELQAFRADPSRVSAARAEQRHQMEVRIAYDNPPVLDDMRRAADANRAAVTDPATREKLRPQVPLGAQRPLYSNAYYPAFNLPHVKVLAGGAKRIDAQTITTPEGQSAPLDTLILATGYHANKFLSVIELTGRDGLRLSDAWRDGPQAYLGITTAGFPNLFMLYGPNTNNGSILQMIEYQCDYILRKLNRMRRLNLPWIDIRRDVMNRYNDALQQAIKAVAPWQAQGSAYYRAPSGRIVTQWPHNMAAYHAAINADDDALYETAAVTLP